VRLERVVVPWRRQGVDPRAVNVDWVTLRKRQEDRAKDDVKAELVIDRIASEEKIDVTDEEVDHELEHMGRHSGEIRRSVARSFDKAGSAR